MVVTRPREQERRVSRELELRHDADLGHMHDGIALLTVARDSRRRFIPVADLAQSAEDPYGNVWRVFYDLAWEEREQ